MIQTMLRLRLGKPLLQKITLPFSSKITPQSLYPQEEKVEVINYEAIIDSERRNVMKNYDLFLPGVYVRNEFAFQQDMWETKSKRHRHAKLKRNRRKGPRRTIITN